MFWDKFYTTAHMIEVHTHLPLENTLSTPTPQTPYLALILGQYFRYYTIWQQVGGRILFQFYI
jgi:hypothetical protein